jgi:hypothetical protein
VSGSNFSGANLITVAKRIKTCSVLLEFLKFRVLAAGQEFLLVPALSIDVSGWR